jgi:SAM-dependent methyltransferase
MKPPAKKHHWQNRHRFVSGQRMAWHGASGDEQYWHAYWQARLNTNYYRSAETLKLADDELGRLLLQALRPDGLHLEAGCGAGYWVAALKHHGFNIEGIENAPDLVDLVHSAYPQLPLRYGDALAIDRPDNSYDSYLSFGVVEHRFAGPEPFLAEAYRVLKPGGKIIISVPFFGPLRMFKARLSLYDRERPHLPFFQYGFSQSEFTELLQQAGFVVEHVQGIYVHRLLLEEVPLYRLVAEQSWSRRIKKWISILLHNRDGHMLVVLASKPVD